MSCRRAFVRAIGGGLLAGPLSRLDRMARLEVGRRLAVPTAAQRAWQDLEVGMFVHFAPNTWQDAEGDQRTTPLDRMMAEIDTDQWADVAVSLGARYLVMVAKHAGGFCLWQTRTNDYGIRNTPWKGGRGDVMADLARSCAARGLRLGVYLSPRDDSLGAGLSGRCSTQALQRRYNRIARQQLTELLTRYGPMVEIWFDGSSIVPVGDILAAHAGDAMIFQGPHATIRWVGNEDGFAPYPAWNAVAGLDARTGIATAIHGDPEGDVWLPNEVDVSIRRPDWFWHTDNARNLLSQDALIEIYYRSVGRGAQLLLNLPPDRTGRIPAADAARAAGFGAEIERRFGSPLGRVAGTGNALALELAEPARVDLVVLAEDLRGGERVRRYRVEAQADSEWIMVAEGTAIGHKRVQPIEPTSARRLRLTVLEAADTPRIRTLAAHATGSEPPPGWNEPAPAWADDDAGHWRGGGFELDLTRKVPSPGTYRLRFVGQTGPASVDSAELTVGDTPTPGMLRRATNRHDVLLLTIPQVGQPILIRGVVSGSSAGTMVCRRLTSR